MADVTGEVNAFVAARGIARGLCILTVGGPGCGLSLAASLDESAEDLLRLGRRYLSEMGQDEPGSDSASTGDRADVEEAVYAPAGVLAGSISLEVRHGALHLGSWDAVVLVTGSGPETRPVDVVLLGS